MLQEEIRNTNPTRLESAKALWVGTWLLGNTEGWDDTLLGLRLWGAWLARVSGASLDVGVMSSSPMSDIGLFQKVFSNRL